MAEIRPCGKIGWAYCDGICTKCQTGITFTTTTTPPSNGLYPTVMSHYPVSNADRIRAMSDEELAAWLDELVEHNWLDWLKQEVDE